MGYVVVLTGEGDEQNLHDVQTILHAAGLQVKSGNAALPGAQDVILLLSPNPINPATLETARHNGTPLHPIILEGDDIAFPTDVPAPLDLRHEEHSQKFYDLLRTLRRRQGLRPTPQEDRQITGWLAQRWLARGRILAYTFKRVPDAADLQQHCLPDIWQSIFAWEPGAYPRVLIDLRPVGLIAIVRSLLRQPIGDQANEPDDGLSTQIAFVLACGTTAIVLPGRCCAGLAIRFMEQEHSEDADLGDLRAFLRFFASRRKALRWLQAPAAIP
jgi:hypothetical protein